MADTEKKYTLTVGTGTSTKSVKDLKSEIQNLQNTILNLEKGTTEYNDAVARLQANQRQLNEVMSLTRRDAVALEGSYDALTYRMAELKKEWKATNDEARRNELGRQIDEINTQLKELDASTGNYQRNVGNYTEAAVDAFAKLKQEIKDARNELLNAEEGTEEYNKAMQKLADAQFQIRDMNEQSRYAVADFGEQLSNVAGITSGVVSGFSALQAAMVLTGNDTEEFEEVMVRLQATMALVQGLQGLEGMVDRVKGLGKALTTVMKSMGKAGWIGLLLTAITVITALTVKLVKKNRALKDGTAYQKEMTKAYGETLKEQAKEIAQLETYLKFATNTAILDIYGKREEAAARLLEMLGLEANQMNINALIVGETTRKSFPELEAAYKKITEAVYKRIDALKEEAKAEAIFNTLVSKYEEMFDTEVKLMDATGEKKKKRLQKQLDEQEAAINKWLAKMVTNTDINAILKSSSDEEEKETWAAKADKELAALDAIYQRRVEYAQMTEKTEEQQARDVYKINQEWSSKREAIINSYLEKAKEVPVELESIKTLTDQLLDEELKSAKLAYDEKKRIAEAEKKVKEELLKNTETYYQRQNDALEHHRDMMLGWNEISIKSDEEKAEESYMINQKYWRDRVKLLEENLAILKADEFANADAIIELERQKSEAILQIETDRYDELDRLRAERREKERQQLESGEWGASIDLRTNAASDDPTTSNDDAYIAERAYQIQMEALEKRQSLLKEFYQNAMNDGDAEAMLDYERQIAETEVEIAETKYAELDRLQQEHIQKRQEGLDILMASFDALGNVMDAIYANMEANAMENGEISEEEARKLKNVQIAQTWISTLSGAVQAFASAMELGPVVGPIVGGINAAAMIAMGIANVKQIKNTDFTGSVNTGGSNVPSPGTYQTELPFSYTRQVTTASDIDELNKDNRVYILESDLEESRNRVQIREKESTF